MKARKSKKSFSPEIEEISSESSSALPEGAVFVLIALVILLFGLSVLYSASSMMTGSAFFQKQLVYAACGFAFFIGAIIFGYKWLSDWSVLILFATAALLVVPLVQRHGIKGAYRWINLGPVNIQPSEFAKIAIVLFLGKFLSMRTRQIETQQFWHVFVPGSMVCCFMIGLVFLGKDLGTSALLGIVFLMMMYVGGIKWYWVAGSVASLTALAGSYVYFFSPERLSRITSFLDPEKCMLDDGYQLYQSMLALGSGGIWGVGFTHSRLKLRYLPEAHTDFILSIVGEELGFAVVIGVMTAYVILFFVGILIATKARTRQGRLVAFGMTLFLAVQSFINMGVICGALPTKGMPAPLISYGGSNLVVCIAAIGIIFSVALDSHYPEYPEAIRRAIGFSRSKAKKDRKSSK